MLYTSLAGRLLSQRLVVVYSGLCVVSSGSKWLQMVWCGFIQYVCNFIWLHMVSSGSVWFLLLRVWFHLVVCGFTWLGVISSDSGVVSSVSMRLHLEYVCFHLVHVGAATAPGKT
jgi:hypothetical protein